MNLIKKKECVLQIGGSDQWGNIVNGVELIKRYSGNQAYGLTTPLITLASGAKMGKTETGAIWLDKNYLSPYDYWQFWRNTDDRDVIKFLKIFTDLEIEEIESIKDSNINNLKKLLANKATEMLHGRDEAIKSEQTAIEAFSGDFDSSNLPSINLDKNKINSETSIIEILILSKLEKSKSEIRRLIKNNGIKINNEVLNDENLKINFKDYKDNSFKLSIGKKRHFKIHLV